MILHRSRWNPIVFSAEDKIMKLLFKQKVFSWFDSYNVFDEDGNTVFTVKGAVSLGHLLNVFDGMGNKIGYVKQKIFSTLPRFDIFIGDSRIGSISKKFSLFKPKFSIDFNGWQVSGNMLGRDYGVVDSEGKAVASVSKQIWNVGDTYVIDVCDPADAVYAMLLVIAIDAERS